jgi:hypothetical protein
MSNVSKYLDYCHETISKIKENEEVKFTIHEFGFTNALHNLVQEYDGCDESQRVIIKEVLEKSIDIILSYLMPINFQRKDFILLPTEVVGNLISTNEKVTYSEGDLHIAFLLLKMAILFKNKKLFHLANMIGTVSEYSIENRESDSLTSSFEDGTIGIALVYQTMFFLTKIKFYKQQSEYWYLATKKEFVDFSSKIADNARFNLENAINSFENPENNAWRKKYFLEF